MQKEDMHKQGCQIHIYCTQTAGSAELECFVQGVFSLVETLCSFFAGLETSEIVKVLLLLSKAAFKRRTSTDRNRLDLQGITCYQYALLSHPYLKIFFFILIKICLTGNKQTKLWKVEIKQVVLYELQ